MKTYTIYTADGSTVNWFSTLRGARAFVARVDPTYVIVDETESPKWEPVHYPYAY